MLVWLLLGVFNFLLAILAERDFYTRRRNSVVCLSLIVVVNTIIIGLRDFGVGADTVVYIDSYFSYSQSFNTFYDFLSSNDGYDKGFVVLAYISSLFSNDSQSLLLVVEFFISFFVILAIYEYKKIADINFSIFILLFWLLCNVDTINLMRQFCAVSLLFYGFTFFLRKKYYVFFVIQLVSYFFHTSSFLFLIVPLFFYVSSFSNNKIKYLFSFVLILLFVIILYFYYSLLSLLGNFSILNDVYLDRYGEGSMYTNEDGKLSLRDIVKYIFIFIGLFIVSKKKYFSENYRYILFMLSLTYVFFDGMQVIMIYFSRLGYYMALVWIVYFSKTITFKYDLKVYNILFVIFLFINAYYHYGYISPYNKNIGNVYHSQILGL